MGLGVPRIHRFEQFFELMYVGPCIIVIVEE